MADRSSRQEDSAVADVKHFYLQYIIQQQKKTITYGDDVLRCTLGPNGIGNRNAKGKDFIFLLGANKFRLLLS